MLTLSTLCFSRQATTDIGLQVIFGNNGIQQLIYNGVVLEDLAQNPADAFHIWHLSSTDLQGNVLNSGQYGWGEINNSRTWDAASSSFTYSFVWGSIIVQFAHSGNTLDIKVTEINNSGSGIVLNGSNIYPFVLHFPALPEGFTDSSSAQLTSNTTGPSVTLADFHSGEVAAVDIDPVRPLYIGFFPANQAASYTPVIASTKIDSLASFFPVVNRPLQPGQSDTYTMSLRFAPAGTAATVIASDAYRNWAIQWPRELDWVDHRTIGTVYLASSPQGDPTRPGGFANNPRRYYGDSNPNNFDIRTTAGLAAFQTRILEQALSNVQNGERMNAQGVLTWDIEGEEYPQPTSYVCEPDEIASVSPEMESVIGNSASPYFGMKLDDAYFEIMRRAGLRIGICVRPQHYTINEDRTAHQAYLPDGEIVSELVRKIRYAHDRWGATLFYVDSNVDTNGAPLDCGIFQQLAATFSDSLIIPEHSTPKYYAYTAPFSSFLAQGQVSTPPEVHNYYPYAFSVTLVNDVDANVLAQNSPALTSAVKNGDILMGHVDYWQANDPTIVEIYQQAGVGTPPLPRVPAANPPVLEARVTMVGADSGAPLKGTVPVSVQAPESLAPAGCVLAVDGNPIFPVTEKSPYLFLIDTEEFSNGWHTIQAIAQDASGSPLLSQDVPILIHNVNLAHEPCPPLLPVQPIGPVRSPKQRN